MYNRLLKNWWLPLKQPDIVCMKVGYDNRNSSYIEVYVFVVQYMLALSTIFFFSRKPHAQIKAYKIVFVFDIWRSKFEINV